MSLNESQVKEIVSYPSTLVMQLEASLSASRGSREADNRQTLMLVS